MHKQLQKLTLTTKKLKSFFALAVGFILTANVFAYSNPGTPTGYVNDFSNTLTAEQIQTLNDKLTNFEKETTNEISVVLIKNLGDDYIENYAVKLFGDWGIGKKDKDNGVLILVAMEDHKMRIEVGYGLEGALTDAQSTWVNENQMKPAFKEGKYYEGINDAVDKIIAITKGEYTPDTTASTKENKTDDIVGMAFLFLFLAFQFFAGIMANTKSWWLGGVLGAVAALIMGWIFGWPFAVVAFFILVPLGLLLDFILSKIGKLTGGKGGGFFSSGSSSGGSSSGGFGGFSGGSSGGGGSSSSW